MNSARLSRVCVTSAMSWEVSASSMLRMSSSCWSSLSSDQQDRKAALNRDQHDRRAGEDDSLSRTTLRRRSHSSQSSLDTFLAAPQACGKTDVFHFSIALGTTWEQHRTNECHR
ncbi:hypothetical protein EYF80_043907 [Liparis tanakae]|uniref:Uncharacterized protein n=1 Tax=Liparis tanakae TaxID=230148 RepID=A0A4Z2FXE2_9TELE|nr:hypothetical protein EYF80_043907 [Liparis tanakae]